MQITLAKALKLKNRLTKKLNDVRSEVLANNQIMVGNTRNVDVNQQMQLAARIQDAIINLKTAINQANMPITPIILLNAELKGEISFLTGIPRMDGKQMSGGYLENKTIEYSSVFNHQMITGLVRNCEESIDKNQDTIDTHNHTTMIDVADEVFDLLKG